VDGQSQRRSAMLDAVITIWPHNALRRLQNSETGKTVYPVSYPNIRREQIVHKIYWDAVYYPIAAIPAEMGARGCHELDG
jgi:hypothetical protein